MKKLTFGADGPEAVVFCISRDSGSRVMWSWRPMDEAETLWPRRTTYGDKLSAVTAAISAGFRQVFEQT